jgi:hypothetical protein
LAAISRRTSGQPHERWSLRLSDGCTRSSAASGSSPCFNASASLQRCASGIDVVALAAQQANSLRRVLSLGEVKWGEVIDHHHLERLAPARDLLRLKGYDTETTVLALYGGAGFTDDLAATAAADYRVLFITLTACARERTSDEIQRNASGVETLVRHAEWSAIPVA